MNRPLWENVTDEIYSPDIEEMKKSEPILCDELTMLMGAKEYLETAVHSLGQRLDFSDEFLLPYEKKKLKKEIKILEDRAEILEYKTDILFLKLRIIELFRTYNLAEELEKCQNMA